MGSSARHEVKKSAPKSKRLAAVSGCALDAAPPARHLTGTNAALSRREAPPNDNEISAGGGPLVVR